MDLPITSNKMACRRCGKEDYVDRMLKVGDACPKGKCWMRRPIALTAAADALSCNVVDFLNPEAGAVTIHKEVATSTVQHTPVFMGHMGSDEEEEYYRQLGMC